MNEPFPDASQLIGETEKLSTALLQERVKNGYLTAQNGAFRVAAIRILQDAGRGQISTAALLQLNRALHYREDEHGIHCLD